jgi:hypothetical protein
MKRAADTPAQPWTQAKLVELLRVRYPSRSHALLPQVRSETGSGSRDVRTADAIVMSLWPSRGIEMLGFELKVSKTDWRKELADPAKAEEIAQYCDAWWIVAPPGVVDVAELPKPWGLLVPSAARDCLVAAKEAPALDAKPLTKTFLASILRRAQEVVVPEARLEAEYERGRADGKKQADWESALLRKSVEEFERASGVCISSAWKGGRIGEAVAAVLLDGSENALWTERYYRDEIEGLRTRALSIARSIQDHFEAADKRRAQDARLLVVKPSRS